MDALDPEFLARPGEPLILLYVPCGSAEEARLLGHRLVEAGLIACANLHPIQSIYRWEGRVVEEGEVVLLAKTTGARADAAEAAIRQHHHYTVPCILRLPVSGINADYLAWVRNAVA